MNRLPAHGLVLPLAALIGWAGMFVHNIAELPGQTFLSPESLIPFLGSAALVAGWFTPFKHAAAVALLAWALLHFFGGGLLSVLPLPVLPFEPQQTPSHYLFHGLYALAQLPLIVSTVGWLRTYRPKDQGRPPRIAS